MKSNSFEPNILKEFEKLPNQFLADLAYLLISPELRHLKMPADQAFSLQLSATELREILKSLHRSPLKENFQHLPLGKYAEELFAYYFRMAENYELLAHNLQLNEEGLTVGEIDFLLFNKRKGQYLHLEVALKYYLKVERDKRPIFLGPSTKDWFARKIDKLHNQQLNLCKDYAHLLPPEFANKQFSTFQLIKGCLFYPYQSWENIEPTYSNAWWLQHQEVESLLSNHGNYRIITDRKDWINPFRLTNLMKKKDCCEKLAQLFLEGQNEVMLVRFNEQKKVIDRGFVMRDGWPN
ncbi:MAG: DUF1853 family protein [Vicingaceae bacterium]